jgi:hypothetical protein
MPAKISAACLVVLILLPFTPPFSTCDLHTLFHTEFHAGTTGDCVPLQSSRGLPSLVDAATAHALPIARAAGRLELLALSHHGPRPVAVVPVTLWYAHATAAPFANLPSAFSAPRRI